MAEAFLAARLDDELVLLDLARAAVVLLDPWSAKVWQACEGRAFEDLCAVLDGSRRRLRRALRDLEHAGLVINNGAGWKRMTARHV